jgi:hypothetical protein
MRRWI